MYTVNINENKAIIYSNKQNNKNSNLKDGNIIEGTIVSFSGKNALIQIYDKTIETDKDNIIGDVGDKINFEVTNNKDGVQLKQINKKDFHIIQQNEKAKYNKNLLEKDNRDYLDIEEKSTLQKEVERKIELANLKRKIKADYNSLNKNVVKKIMQQKGNLDNMSITDIASVQRDVEQNISDMSNEDIKEMLQKNNINKSNYNEVIFQFKNNGLNFNDYNLLAISSAIEKFDNVVNNAQNINTSYAIKTNGNLSINSLNISMNISNKKNVAENMTSEIKQFLSKNNIEVSDINISNAMHLLNNEMDISKNNMDKVNFVNNELKEISKNNLIYNFVNALQNGQNPAEIDLMNLSNSTKQVHNINLNILNEISNVSDETLAYLEENNIQYTLNNIVENKNNGSNIILSENALTAKRQMLDIQLRLTSEVSFSLANKGIEIDIMPLKDALNEIKAVENAIYSKVLGVQGLEGSKEQLSNINETLGKVKLFNETTNNVYKKLITNEIEFNINDISNEIVSNKMAKNYEENQTVINPKYKDSFEKVKEQISPLLKSLNIEDNNLNVKATSVLIKNKMDVTEENINKVLLIDTKINKVNAELQPSVVLKMLQENINPLTLNIENVLNYINDYNEQHDIKNIENENIIKNLIKLEKDKGVTEEELKTIKAVYRAINYSVKNDVGMGALINAEHDFTIANLLDSAKYMQKTKGTNNYLDKVVNDEIGEIDNNNKEHLTLKEQVESQLNKYLLQNISKSDNIQFIKQLSNEDNTIKSLFNENVESELLENELVQQLNEIQKTNDEKVHEYLLKNNMPITINNMQVAKDILKDNLSQSKKLKSAFNKNDKIKDKLYDISKDKLENEVLENSVLSNIINELINEDVEADVEKLNLQQQLIQSMKFQDEYNKSNEHQHELPILLPLSSEATNLKMYIPNKKALSNNEKDVLFSLSTKNLGNLKVVANYDEKLKSLKITFENENKEVIQKLNSDKQHLVQNLKSLGINNIIFETV